ncbi:MAG TPA: SMP-30/gluconolactonase/LRE family protein [Burkholderiaceae bacterium]|nr:SMP-30/gluconolactonase/LRE family protein [Burkholderiaceae bacterium]
MSGAPIELRTTVIADGFVFPEALRWHTGSLWFSDMLDGKVFRLGADGRPQLVVEVAQQPSGLGWLPDGALLVVSMIDRRLLRYDGGPLTTLADLSALAPFHCNDMVVDAAGRAYVGNFGFDLPSQAPPAPTVLLLVTPEGRARAVADGLLFPNGCAITPGGGTLIVAETFGARLTAFSIAADGSLGNRRTWAELPGASPDGICLDAEGAVWVASPTARAVLRVREGGTITHRVPVQTQAIACTLGGADRRTLYVATGHVSFNREKARRYRSGRIEAVRVDVPGAGLP